MSRRRWVVWGMMMVLAFASVAAAEEGWGLSKLNPFKKSPPSKRVHSSVSDGSSGYKMPKLSLPSWGSKSTAPKPGKKPSTLAKVNKSTKKLWNQTKTALTPGKGSKKPTPSRTASSKPTKSKFWPSSWLPQKKEEKRPETVIDFLGAKRPESEF